MTEGSLVVDDVVHHERVGERGTVHILRVTMKTKVMELEFSQELWQALGENAKWFKNGASK